MDREAIEVLFDICINTILFDDYDYDIIWFTFFVSL